MALVSGFLRQKCSWKKRPQASDEFDDFGQPIGASAPPSFFVPKINVCKINS